MIPLTAQPKLTFEEFRIKIEQEFIHGSAIDPGIFAQIRICRDLEIDSQGNIETPIHDALNWRYTRFGHQATPNQYGAILYQENGEGWQVKLAFPKWDALKGKYRKYESIKGGGSRAYLPPINRTTRRKIAQRYKVKVPPPKQSFWDWLSKHPEIPIIITEGGKKALCLLSQGYVAIALYGINGGYKAKDAQGFPIPRHLIPDIARFAVKGRHITLAFDSDAEAKTRLSVNKALSRFGGLLVAAGCEVAIACWDNKLGKGVDDLIVNCGVSAWEIALEGAFPLKHWQITQRLENRLSYPPSVRLTTADLSTLALNNLPQSGVIAIASPKATGKTKLIGQITAHAQKVLVGGHRIALTRNLCYRLGIDYRGDLDKVNGQFINGAGYVLKVGFCVDALLSINPENFAGCDLILDEVVQVVRHLLTSSTCAKDGKRPALLARFAEIIRVAKRVIIADADLNNATIQYIMELRDDNLPVFLLRNDIETPGYPVKFIRATDRTAIVSDLLADLQNLEPGKAIFVTTDSKITSKTLARTFEQIIPKETILLLNSETSGGSCEQEFIEIPDTILKTHKYRLIISSPTLATGNSIEAQGIVAKVYGIFTGASSTDEDMAQALMRVREPVPRVVWCAVRGNNFCRVSRSTNPLEIKSHLLTSTSATVSLTRSNLRADTVEAISGFNWQADPHVNMFTRISADQNFSMYNLRDALLVRLKHEGNLVTPEDRDKSSALGVLLKDIRHQMKVDDATALIAAREINYTEALLLESQEVLEPDDRLALSKFYLKDFYCLDELTVEDVLIDNEGRRRGELLNLEAQLYPGVALDYTARALEKQTNWNQGYCPWDIPGTELRRAMRSHLGLNDFLDSNKEWTHADVKSYADRIRQYAPDIKWVFNFTVSDKVSDVQVVHQLLSQMGVKTDFRWCNSMPGFEGKKIRVFRLDGEHWEASMVVLARRQTRRERIQQHESDKGSPLLLNTQNHEGDPENQQEKPQSLTLIGRVVVMVGCQNQFLVERLEPNGMAWCKNLSDGVAVLLPLSELMPVDGT